MAVHTAGYGNRFVSPNNQGFYLTLNTAFTVECWVNITSNGGYGQYVGNKDAGQKGFGLWCISDGGRGLEGSFYDGNGAGYQAPSMTPTIFYNGTWKHIAFTYDGLHTSGSGQFYYNSASLPTSFVDSGAADYVPTGYGLNIMGDVYAGDHGITGHITELRVWNYKLTRPEVLMNMYRRIVPDTRLQYYYRCDESSFGNLTDLSGKKNHAVKYGTATVVTNPQISLK